MSDDVLSNSSTNSLVAVGGSITGEIERSGDTDWHAVSLEQGQLYAIDLKGLDRGGGSLGDGYLSLRDQSGNHLSTGFADYAGTRDARIEFIAPETGTYFAVAHGQNLSIGTYELSIATIDAFSSVDESSAASTAGERLDTRKEVGPSTNRVDIIFIGEGFTAGEQNDVRNHVDRLTEEMFGYDPLDHYEDYFNVHIINLVSEESGIDDVPDVMVDTALDAGNSFDEFHGRKVLDFDWGLANLEFSTSENFGIDPDIKIVMVNGTGGSGGDIAATEPDAGTLVHEVGHSFARLADEYWYSGNDYEGSYSYRTTNVSDEPLGLPWSHWLGYDDPYTGVVSAFEGAGYHETGLFRPSIFNLMNTSSDDYIVPADAITKEAFIHAIYEVVDPIDYHTAAGSTLVDPNTVFVDLIGNIINVEWSINGVLIDDNSPLYSYIEVHEDRQTLDISKLSLSNGLYEISARAFDPTDMVRVDRSDLEQTVVWNCSITNSSEDQAADDFTQDRNTSSLITIGDTTDAAIDFIGDQDWHEVSLSAGQLYQISLTGLDGSGGTLPDPKFVGIYNNSGTLIPWSGNNDFDGSHDSQVEFLADASETYFVSVGSNTTDTGSYSIKVVPIDRSSDDFAESPLTPSLIDLGISVEGVIGVVGDVDWHGVALSAGQRYQFKLSGKSGSSGALNKPEFVGVYTQAGERIDYLSAVVSGSRDRSQLDFYAPETATYYIAAGAADGDTGSYEITSNTAERVLAYSTVEVGGSVTGEIDSRGYLEKHRVSLEAGESYLVNAEGTGEQRWHITVFDAAFQRVGAPYFSSLEIGAQKTGSYYIVPSLGTFNGIPLTGAYTLSVKDWPGTEDDFPGSVYTNSVVLVGGSVTGEIELIGDMDWHSVSLVAGETYKIEINWADGSWSWMSDLYLDRIYDASGSFVPGKYWYGSSETPKRFLEFKPDASGTYYINTVGSGSNTGTYTLSVQTWADTGDDFLASELTTSVVTVGGFVTGEIENSGDADWHAVSLVAGETYAIDLKGADGDWGTLTDPALRQIYDAEWFINNTSDNDSGVGKNSYLEFRPEASGTYYINAEGSGSDTGTYTLSVQNWADTGDDFLASEFTSSVVTVGGSVAGEIGRAGDRDWHAVSFLAGETYVIDLKGANGNWGTLADPLIYYIYDASGSAIALTDDKDSGVGENSSVEFRPEESGTFYLSAAGEDDNTGTYTLSVQNWAGTGDDFRAGEFTTSVATVGGSVTGEIESAGDKDWHAISLVAGETYVIDLKGADGDWGTLSDPYLNFIYTGADGDWGTLSDPYLNFIYTSKQRIGGTYDYDSGSGENSYLEFRPEVSGTYYINAAGSGDDTGTYTLSVQTFSDSGDDFLASELSTSFVTVGGSVIGEIERSGDRDWHAVSFVAGETYVIDLKGADGDWGTLADPVLQYIYDASGWFISGTSDRNSGFGENSSVEFRSEASGTYYINATGEGDDTGTYTISVQNWKDTGDDFRASEFTTSVVTVGGSVTGEIERSGDRDWHAISLLAGETYLIDLKGADGDWGTLTDPYLDSIYDASGRFISGTNDYDSGVGQNSYLEFRPEASGTYYVTATGEGNHKGTYTLSVQNWVDTSDDFLASGFTTSVVSVGGSVTGEIESSGDADWHAVSLAEGETYVIDLKGSDSDLGMLADPIIYYIYDASGFSINGTYDNDSGAGKNSAVEFRPETRGTYYINAAGSEDHTGTYTLSVQKWADTGDDFLANEFTGSILAVGGSAIGEIETSGDRDWHMVSLVAGETYLIDLKGTDGDWGTLADPYINYIYDAAGSSVNGTYDDDSGAGKNSTVEFRPETSGNYYINADGSGENTGTYTLSVQIFADSGDDFSSDAYTASNVTIGSSITGKIERSGDEDWHAVSLVAGETYVIHLKGANGDWGSLADPDIYYIYDPSGSRIAGTYDFNSGFKNNSYLEFRPETSGTYYINANNSEDLTGTYTLLVENFKDSVDDFLASEFTSSSIAIGGSVAGEIERRGDRDWHSVSLVAGEVYLIDLKGVDGGWGTLADPRLYKIYDASGSYISATSDHDSGYGENSLVVFGPETSGTFYISATGTRDHTGTYTLSVQNFDNIGDDFPSNVGTTSVVSLGGSAPGEIETSGDRDWHMVSLVAGETYLVDLKGADGNWGTLADPYLAAIYDASGSYISGTFDHGSGAGKNSSLEFRPEASGTYYINAAGSGYHTGTYTLSVQTFADSGDDFQASEFTTSVVTVGRSVTGEIERSGDKDWHAISLLAGETYLVDLKGTDGDWGTLADPYLAAIYDASGSSISGTYDNNSGSGKNSFLEFRFAASGTYYINAAGSGDDTGTYTLSIQNWADTGDDFLASEFTSSVVTVGGSVAGEIGRAGDRDWHAVSLLVGETYVIDLKGADGNWGTLADPYLAAIYDASGSYISGTSDYDSGSGENSSLEFIPDTSGTYYINAKGYQDSIGTYTLSVTTQVSASNTDEIITEPNAQGETFTFEKDVNDNKQTLIDNFNSDKDKIVFLGFDDDGIVKTLASDGGDHFIFVQDNETIGEVKLSPNIQSSLLSVNNVTDASITLSGETDTIVNISNNGELSIFNQTSFSAVTVNGLNKFKNQISIMGETEASDPINLSDVLAQLKHIIGLRELKANALQAGDTNNDGEVNLSDVLDNLKHIIGLRQIDTFDLVTDNGFSINSLNLDSAGNLALVINGDADQSHADWDFV